MSQTFRWLHLTDLHWGPSNTHQKDWPSIYDELKKDIERMEQPDRCGGSWDAIFFTGDLVDRGNPEEFRDLNQKVLSQLLEDLAERNSKPVLIPAPGNHDLRRPRVTKEKSEKIFDWKFENFERVRNNETDSEEWKLVNDAFSPYEAWLEHEAPSTFLKNDKFKKGVLPGEYAITLEKGSFSLGVMILNSAFSQLTGGDYEGRLVLDVSQLQKPCGYHYPKWFEKHDACILLTHHPATWLSKESYNIYMTRMAKSGMFALHLAGHVHKTAINDFTSGGAGKNRRLMTSLSLFGLENYSTTGGKPVEDRRYGYSAGKMELKDDQIGMTLWPRRAFFPDLDGIIFAPDFDGGMDERGNMGLPTLWFPSSRKKKINDSDGEPKRPYFSDAIDQIEGLFQKADVKNLKLLFLDQVKRHHVLKGAPNCHTVLTQLSLHDLLNHFQWAIDEYFDTRMTENLNGKQRADLVKRLEILLGHILQARVEANIDDLILEGAISGSSTLWQVPTKFLQVIEIIVTAVSTHAGPPRWRHVDHFANGAGLQGLGLIKGPKALPEQGPLEEHTVHEMMSDCLKVYYPNLREKYPDELVPYDQTLFDTIKYKIRRSKTNDKIETVYLLLGDQDQGVDRVSAELLSLIEDRLGDIQLVTIGGNSSLWWGDVDEGMVLDIIRDIVIALEEFKKD